MIILRQVLRSWTFISYTRFEYQIIIHTETKNMCFMSVFRVDWDIDIMIFNCPPPPLTLVTPPAVYRHQNGNPQYWTMFLRAAFIVLLCPPYSGTTGQTTPSSRSTRDTGGFIPCSPSTSCILALSGRSGNEYKTTWPSPSRRTRPPPGCLVCET